MKICVYTAIFDDYVLLKPPHKLSATVDLVCFANRGVQGPGVNVWSMRYCSAIFAHPRMDSKWYRMNSDLVLSEYDMTIWVDASFQIGDLDRFVSSCISDLGDHKTALFRHPEQKNIYEEATASLRVCPKKYVTEPLIAQVENYRRKGLPDDHVLWAGGIQIRQNRSQLVSELNRRWFAECVQWSYQDQLSLPYVLWKMGVPDLVGTLHGSVYRGDDYEWTRGADR